MSDGAAIVAAIILALSMQCAAHQVKEGLTAGADRIASEISRHGDRIYQAADLHGIRTQ